MLAVHFGDVLGRFVDVEAFACDEEWARARASRDGDGAVVVVEARLGDADDGDLDGLVEARAQAGSVRT